MSAYLPAIMSVNFFMRIIHWLEINTYWLYPPAQIVWKGTIWWEVMGPYSSLEGQTLTPGEESLVKFPSPSCI